MPGLVPGIHVLVHLVLVHLSEQVVDGRTKPGHDGACVQTLRLRANGSAQSAARWQAPRSNPETDVAVLDCLVASRLAMMGWTAPDGINVPDWW